jgi:hypothetical protein
MKASFAAFAVMALIASAAFAHTGDVTTIDGDVRIGNYKVISISASDALLLEGDTCNVEAYSGTGDLVQAPNREQVRADFVNISACYPLNRSARLSITRLTEAHQVRGSGYNYMFVLDLDTNTDRFPIPSYWTQRHATMARCTQVQSRLTCSILGGGTLVLDLL